MRISSPTTQCDPAIPFDDPGEIAALQRRQYQIDRCAHRMIDPILGEEPASFIAGTVYLWFVERRSTEPGFLADPREFRRGIKRKIHDELRKTLRETDQCENIDVAELVVGDTTFTRRSPNPAEVVERSETIWRVQRAIAKLPPQMQRVIRLYDIEGLTAAEVAGALGIAVATVRRTRHDAITLLGTILAPADERRCA